MLLYLKDEFHVAQTIFEGRAHAALRSDGNFDLLPPNTHKHMHVHMHAHTTTFAGRDMSFFRRSITMEILGLDKRLSASNYRAVLP